MNPNKSLVLLALLLAFLPGILVAQAAKTAPKAQAILVFSDDDTQLVLTDPKGNPLIPNEGMVLPVGTVVKTLKTTAEIQLKPNGTIVKLAASTTFKIQNLRETDGTGSNDFALLQGKLRTVAAKLAGLKVPGYNISTPTANCGVRGTDFAMDYDPANQLDWVCVQEGQVEYTNITTGVTVPVALNEMANTFDATFQSNAVDPAKMTELFSDLDFVRLDPKLVPSKEVTEAPPATPAPATPAAPAPVTAVAPSPAAPAPGGSDFLQKLLGIEVGSVTINGTTYSKAILTPTIDLDKFKLGLYLPIIYTNDMMNPHTWYKPSGNNEWSFGTDQSGFSNQLKDLATDLLLKIKYLEWGVQGEDPYYLKVGNLEDMTLGHGTVVRNLANDQDFPSVRKIGLNAGAKLGSFAVEGLADNVTDPAVVGGRVAVDFIPDQFVIGLQTAADLHLADPLSLALDPNFSMFTASQLGDPVLMVGGVDAQFFKIDLGPVFQTKAFADLNTLAVYYRQEPISFLNLSQGLNYTTAWHDGKPGSYGGEAGFMGSIATVNYRLSYQVDRGVYTDALFSGDYYRTRNTTLGEVLKYDSNAAFRTTQDQGYTMGIYGSADCNLFGMLIFGASYTYPFQVDASGAVSFNTDDNFLLRLDIPKGKIPLVPVSGGFAYERNHFASAIHDGVSLFDANTVLSGHVTYGIAPGLDLALSVSTAVLMDSSGNIEYGSDGKPRVAPTITLDTKVSL